jgi:hypothetical protein
MKSVKKKITRVQLKMNKTDELIILGLVSSEPDYKLSLALNKEFGISLRNSSPVRIIDNAESELTFSRFSNTSSSSGKIYTLVSNRSGTQFLLKKLKNVDYILLVHDPENENNIELLSTSLREIESISGVFNIDLHTFKDKNLLYLT